MKKPLLRLSLLLSVLPAAAFAQAPPAEDYTLIGAGLRSRPAYDGSKSRTGDVIPVLRYYGKPWFARTTYGILEGGARTELAPGLALGAQLAYEPGRKQSEADLLRNLGAPDVDPGASVGMHLEWDSRLGPVPFSLLGRVRQQADTDRGAQADLRLTAGIYASGPARAALFTQATWANRKSNRTYYGRPGFDPDGGLLYLSLGAEGSFDLSRQWLLVGSVEGRRLRGDAANSPLTERKSSAYASAGLAYRF